MSALLDVYRLDKIAAQVCCEMQVTGFAFDQARADVLAEALRNAEADARKRAEDAVNRKIAAPKGKSDGFATNDLNAAFFGDLRAPVYFRSELTGRPSLGVDTLRAYAACADKRLAALALAVLDQRRARKVRSTYVDGVDVGADGCVHPTWLNYGAVSGRWACQGPNLMNLPRPENDPTHSMGGIRSLYVPHLLRDGTPDPDWLLVTFDAKQLEMRVAAYASGDEAMISACESSDLHASNAAIIFGDAFDAATYFALSELKALGKLIPDQAAQLKALSAFRTLAKSSGFAVCYMAEAATVYARLVAAGVQVTLRQVEAMLQRMRRGFHQYYRWQSARLLDCVRLGYTDEPVTGRRRELGHDPAPTECANFPIQGGAAGIMNRKLPAIVATLRKRAPDARIVAQVHDSGVFKAPRSQAAEVAAVCREVFAEPVVIASSGRALEAVFPIDVEVSERWH